MVNENLLGMQNNKNIDLSHLINNNDAIDLITIQAKKILTDIKRMINIPLNVEQAKKIDDDFIISLKKMIVINNNNISNEYLIELSYVYFAAYNSTLDVYYQLKEKDEMLYYWLLDSSLYNNTNDNNKINWSQYDRKTKHVLEIAYEKGVLNELMSIFEINLNESFNSIQDYQLSELFEKENFEKFVNLFGKEIIAKSDIEMLLTAQNSLLDYTKQLIKINPNIIFLKDVIFDPDLMNVFDIKEIAFFSEKNILELDYIYKNVSSFIFKDVVNFYKEVITISPEFVFEKSDIELITDVIRNSFSDFPANVFIQLNEEEKEKIKKLMQHYIHARVLDEWGIIEKKKLCHYLKGLNKLYGEPKQKKLKR